MFFYYFCHNKNMEKIKGKIKNNYENNINKISKYIENIKYFLFFKYLVLFLKSGK